MKGLIGMQSHNKEELKKFLKGKSTKAQKSLKVVSVSKPSWWHGKWPKTYELKKK